MSKLTIEELKELKDAAAIAAWDVYTTAYAAWGAAADAAYAAADADYTAAYAAYAAVDTACDAYKDALNKKEGV